MSFLGDIQSFLGSYVEVYGLVGLFIATLLGGTLVPLSCDAFAVLALGLGMPLVPVIIVASLGTAFGGLSTFVVGRAGSNKLQERMSEKKLKKYQKLFRSKGGSFLIFFSSLTPVPFDPCALAAGSLKMPIAKFVGVSFIGRFVRYILLLTYVQYAILGGSSSNAALFLIIGMIILIAITFMSFIIWRKMGIRENTIIDRALDRLEGLIGNYDDIKKRRSKTYSDLYEKGKKLREEMSDKDED